MGHQVIQTDRAPAAIGPYSQAVKVDKWLFVSGQIGFVPATGQLVGDSLVEQARQALQNMHQILTAGGCGLTDVVAVDVFLIDMGQFSSFNGIYEEFFAGHKPARAVVEVKGLPREALVEIKCIACKNA
jgi:2-iminobutanoate/2-iminopropanoate deaminase